MSFEYFEAESHVLTYSQFRPSPPKELIEKIINFTKEKISEPLELGVDIGCGSGQSTEILAPYFKKVIGFDPSEQIIAQARKKCKIPNVTYSTCPAENIPLNDNSVNVITACQAVHWFDVEKFYNEVNRILRNNGVLAVYGYHLPVPVIGGREEIYGELVKKYYSEVLGKYVLPESRKVYLENYKSKEFNDVPYIEGGRMIREENFCEEIETNLQGIIGYISSWSGFQNYRKQVGEKESEAVLKNFENEFKSLAEISDLSKPFKVKFNYFLLLGRKKN